MEFSTQRIVKWMDNAEKLGMLRTDVVRLIEKFDIKDANGCWLWNGAVDGAGYGQIAMRRNAPAKAHRVAYVFEHGEIPEGLEIDHLCRTPPCCRPDHLEAVTHQENLKRAYRGRTHFRCGHPKDAEHTYIRPSDGKERCHLCKKAQESAGYHRRVNT